MTAIPEKQYKLLMNDSDAIYIQINEHIIDKWSDLSSVLTDAFIREYEER
jgi:hypothetical protein